MGVIWSLAKRNSRIYLRDKTSVFFSLLAVFIIIGLYALFLGDMQVSNVKHLVGDVDGIEFLVDSWIMSGILVVVSVTITLGALGTMIEDSSRKRLDGFLVTPIRRGHIVWGYLLSSWFVGLALCLVALALTEIYIFIRGGFLLSLPDVLEVVGIVMLNVLSSSAMLFFIMTFIHTSGGFGTLSTILGTLIGFLTGIYIPVGALPSGVQTAVKCIPFSHTAVLMRQIFTKKAVEQVFAGAPAEAVNGYLEAFGVKMTVAGFDVNALIVVGILVTTGLIFFGLSVVRMKMRKD